MSPLPRLNLLAFVVLPLLCTGCVAAAAGAAGASVATDEAAEHVAYYLIVEDPPSDVASALRNAEVIEGMSEAEVRLAMGAKEGYDNWPTQVIDEGATTVWVYESTKSGTLRHRSTRTQRIVLQEGRVVDPDAPAG